jgi:signal transduction histidine kinase
VERITNRGKAKIAFAAAMLLFLFSGMAAYIATMRLVESEKWVVHTHEVQTAIGDVALAIAKAGRARGSYFTTGNDDFRLEFDETSVFVSPALKKLRDLTVDNSKEQEYCAQLEKVVGRRMELFKESVELKRANPAEQKEQARINLEGVPLSSETTRLNDAMNAEEQRLLGQRQKTSSKWLFWAVSLLILTFALGLIFFIFQFYVLSKELEARQFAEHAARKISTRVLQLQDEERARLARDLHDSIGQSLTGAKMMVGLLARNHPGDLRYKDAADLLDTSLAEIRTISHLMHPPGLDEIGLSTAARWFIDGFAQRSGIEIKAEIPDVETRLPRPVEVALYRVLQEGLTNVHKHSKSNRATVQVRFSPTVAVLAIRDFGVGVAPEVLDGFRHDGTSGIGWAGMKGRIEEIGGQFEVNSNSTGTLLLVRVPVGEARLTEETATDLDIARFLNG